MATPRRRTQRPAAPAAPKPAAPVIEGSLAETAPAEGDEPSETEEAFKPGDIEYEQVSAQRGMPVPGDEFADLLYEQAEERRAFVATLRAVATAGVAYGDLIKAVMAEGWSVQLREEATHPTADGGTLITFGLMFGTDAAELQRADQITIKSQGNEHLPSLMARASAYSSVIMALFNQLPPQPEKPSAPQQREETRPPAVPEDFEPLDLVDKRTTDGLPVYFNPFDLTDPSEEIIESLIVSLTEEVPQVMSAEALQTLWTQNAEVFTYVKEMSPKDFERIIGTILEPRFQELEELDPAPTETGGGRRPTKRR